VLGAEATVSRLGAIQSLLTLIVLGLV